MKNLISLALAVGLLTSLPSVLFGQQTGTDGSSDTGQKTYHEQISREFRVETVSTSGGG